MFEGEPITKVTVKILEKKGAIVALEDQERNNRGAAYFSDSELANEVATCIALFLDKAAMVGPSRPSVQLVREDLGLAEQVEFARRDPLVG